MTRASSPRKGNNMENNIAFRPATKSDARLRLALVGPSGSGKTYTALAVATSLGKRVAVIDTERGSASKYADLFSFDVLELSECNPSNYVMALRAAANAGYDVVVIDSLSHAWNGKGGALELVDEVARRSKSGNSFGAWREVTPLHVSLIDEIVGSRMHVIATMRAKTEWSQEKDERGRTQIRKVGLSPIQRDGVEYEFDVVLDMDQDNTAIVTKTRCSALAGKLFPKPGEELAKTLRQWLAGPEAPQQAAPSSTPGELARAQREKVYEQETEALGENNPMAEEPAQPSGALASVLDAIQHARTVEGLKAIAAIAARLNESDRTAARQQYAQRLAELTN